MVPEVSVIIPTKNRAHYVSSAIQSVLDQTFGDFEIIVVDGASIDNTREVISKFDDERICYIREKIDRGASASRNTGIRRSRGKFIAFLDDDDLWMPSKVEKQLQLISEKHSIGAVYTGTLRFNKSGKIIRFQKPYLKGNIFPQILKKNYIGNCSRVMVRRECFDRTGLFDEKLSACEDWDMWIRLAKHYQFDYIIEPLVLYRVHEKGISSNRHAILQATKLMFNKFSADLNASDNARAQKILAYWHYRFGEIYCALGDTEKGKKEFIKAISKEPCSVIYFSRLLASVFGLTTYNALRRLLESSLPTSFRSKVA